MSEDRDFKKHTHRASDCGEKKKQNKLAVETENLKNQIEEYKAGWARAQADYQNLQKEIEAKRSEWVKMSEMQILEEFIPVYDNFKKAFFTDIGDTNNTDTLDQWKSWKQGIEYIMKQYGSILESYGIEEIKTTGEKFNPEFHEAVGEEDGQEDIILKEVDSGYKRGELVVKVAKVIVGK